MIILKTQFTNDIEKNLSSKKSLSLRTKPSIYKTFDKKANAISYIKESENDLKLFSEDLSNDDGCKCFIVSTYDKIYDLSKDKQHHMYENYEADQPLKLILDIDFKIDSKNEADESNIDIFDDILVQAIDTINEKLTDHTNTEPSIIVLKSCRKDKLSAHIIYTNIHYPNIKSMKYFMMSINSPLIEKKIIDPNIYRVGCMRMLWNSKMGKSNVLEYDECDFMTDNRYQYSSGKQLFMDCLLTNIKKSSTLIDFQIPKHISRQKVKAKVVKKTTQHANYHIDIIKQYVDLISDTRADDYCDWLKVGMCIYNCNSDAFSIWDSWSKSSDKYDEDVMAWKWNTFSQGSLTISTLKFMAKMDNPEKYDEITCGLPEELNYEPIDIKQDYLLEVDEKIKDQKSIISESICDWMDGDAEIKTLAIRSTYNTGKTTMIKSILKEFKPQKVLFITHRQSLTNELYGSFKKHGVCSYMNGSFGANKLICQIESLHKILESENSFWYNTDPVEKKFDLIILDEIESLLNHFSSPTVVHKQQTFELMVKILTNGKKILALDGDFHNRAYDFISGLGKTSSKDPVLALCEGKNIVIHNNIVKDIKRYTFISDYKRFNDSINDALEEDKNIVVVSMSSNKGKILYEKHKDTYDTLLHTSKTDDQIKEKLKNVEENWKDCRMLIYSPSVQSGVSFDIPHFDQMFVIMANKSCSARDLSQMTHRIRQFKNNDVLVYLNGLPYREETKFYQYEQMVDYVQSVYKKQKSPVENMFVKNLTYNETEIMNKDRMYIVPQYIKYIKDKGSQYLYEKNINKGVREDLMDYSMQGIIEAEDIDEVKFKQYLDKQNNNTASEAEKYAVEKYMYKKNWGVKEIDQEFMDKWFRKTYVLDNILTLLKGYRIDQLTSYDRGSKNNYLSYDRAKQKERVDIIKDLIDIMGFDLDNIGDDLILDRETFVENMDKCVKDCKIFKDAVDCEFLFGVKMKTVRTVKAFIGFINTVLKNWGLIINFKEESVWNKELKKRIGSYMYNLAYYQDIEIYI